MKRTMAGLSVAVVFFGADVWPAAAPAGADQVAATRGELAAVQSEAAASAGRIRLMTLRYDQANTTATTLAQQAAADRVELGHLRDQVETTRDALREDAIISYTGGDPATPSGASGMVSTHDPAVRAEYLQIAAGDIADVVDRYRTQEGEVATAEAGLEADVRASQAAVARAQAARDTAVREAQALQDQLDSVRAQLAAAVQAQQAAQAEQEAQHQAARAPAPSTQGLPVGNGLVNVVQTIVSPSPSPSPAPAEAGGAGGVWLQLRECESGDNYRADTGNGFYGAYQFSAQTWADLGFPGRPDLEPPAMQDQAAQKLQAESGWGQWPACAAALGLS